MYKFNLIVNKKHSFELSEADLENFDCIATQINSFHVLENNKSINAEIIESDFMNKTYTISVNKNKYSIEIQNDLDLLIQDMGIEKGTSKKIDALIAPMPGLILEVNVAEGQTVNENDTLLILEAMKMENIFVSPRGGIIKSIHIKKGDAVDKGQVLIEFEN